MTKSICFDVIGTCFSFDAIIEAIDQEVGSIIKPANVSAKSLFFSWFYAGQRDFTYLSQCNSYQPIAVVLKSTFRRSLRILDIDAQVSDDSIDVIMNAFANPRPRKGLFECVKGLQEHHQVIAVTNGSAKATEGYFKPCPVDLQSCDSIQRAKPDAEVYKAAAKLCTGEKWFVAAHAWDLLPARQAGFKTAYVRYEEHDSCGNLFGEFDLECESLDELLDKLR